MRATPGGPRHAWGASLRLRLQLLLACLIALVAGTLLVAAAHSMIATLVATGEARARDAARRVASVLEQSAARSRQLLADTAARPELTAFLGAPTDAASMLTAREVLRELSSASPRRATIWTPDGRKILEEALPGTAAAATPIEDLPAPSALPPAGHGIVQESRGVIFADLVAPIRDASGGEAGWLSVRAPVLLNPPGILRQLVGDDATILLGSAEGGTWTDFETVVERPPIEQGAEGQRPDGRKHLGAAAEIGGTPWLVWVELPRDLAVAPASGFMLRLGLLVLALAALALVVADVLAARVVTRPLADLTAAVQTIAQGDYSRRVDPDATAEIGGLGFAFNAMAERISRDIEERKAGDERLRASEAHFRLLFESNPLPMWVYDLQTLAFLEVNHAARERYGFTREEFLAMKITEIRPEEEVPKLLAELDAPREAWQSPKSWKHRLKSGAVIDVEITSHLLTYDGREAAIIVAQDVTERRKLEEQLWEAQKLEAIGTLAGGVAHDFNNVLTVILGFTQFLRQAQDMPAGHQHDLEEIENAARRAQKLTRQLLAFARRQILQPRVFDIDAAVGNVAALLRKLIPENVELTINRQRPGGMILMDPSQFEQILINLAVNAGDAMPRGGRLTIETTTEILDEKYAARHGQVAPGRYVVLNVADTGTGMDEATAKQAFEPFFTTKDVGKGTGLGLATVHGIVKQSGGDIWLYTEPGHGTTFRIYLPEATGAPEQEAERAPAAGAASAGGSETVLVVEDDDAVRPLVRIALQRAGYRVIEACNPKDAVRVATDFGGPIDLLLSDVIMPESDGPALHGLLRASHPDLRVLYMSGYADDTIVRQGILVEGTPFIQKPFSPRSLASKVREVLDA